MQKWDYDVIEAKDHLQFTNLAKVMGIEGWELVHVEYTVGFVIGFMKKLLVE